MDWVTWLLLAWALCMTGLYYRENQYRRDVATDLVQLIHEYDIERTELRRSLGYGEIEAYLDRQD